MDCNYLVRNDGGKFKVSFVFLWIFVFWGEKFRGINKGDVQGVGGRNWE